MADEKSEQKQVELLAENVARRVVQQDVYAGALKAILLAAEADVKEGALEVLLRFKGIIADALNKKWAGLMASVFVSEGTEVPSDPYELRELIQRWVGTSERNIARAKQQEGYLEGYKKAFVEGVKLGWGSANAGKGLAETVQVAETKNP